MGQDAVIVGRVPGKSKSKIGLTLVEGGFSNRPPLDLSRYFRVIDHKPSRIDEDLNERVQREGIHCDGSSDGAQWYSEHKGYSERL